MIKFLYDKYEFCGLKFKKCEEYPWENNIEKNEFYSKLYKELTNYNKEKIFRFLEKETSEEIHINLSKSFISSFLSILFLIIAGVLFTSTVTFTIGIIPWVCICIIVVNSLLALFLQHVYKKKAKISLSMLKLSYSLINGIFKKL